MTNVGIIGCGNIAQVHAWALSQTEDCRITACADCRTERAEKLSRDMTGGAAAVYARWEDLIGQPGLDAVHICLPHYLHVPVAIAALRSGLSVLMEKPPAVTQAEFDSLKAVSAAAPGRIGFCFQNRYNAATKALDTIAASGRLGQVTGARGFVTWRRDEGYYSDDWHGTLEKECGGALLNQSIHTLDLMLRYLGVPEKVNASLQNHHLPGVIEVEDTLEARLETADGKRACFYASTGYAQDAPVIWEIAFENGRVTVMDQALIVQEKDRAPEMIPCAEAPGIGKSCWGSSHLACIRDFYRYLREDKPFMNDIAGVENTLRVTMRIYEEARKQ